MLRVYKHQALVKHNIPVALRLGNCDLFCADRDNFKAHLILATAVFIIKHEKSVKI